MTATTQLSRGFRNFRFTKATEAASSCGTRVRAASLHVPFTPTVEQGLLEAGLVGIGPEIDDEIPFS